MKQKPGVPLKPTELRVVPLFSGLAEAEIEKIAALFMEKTYQQGQSIVNFGEPAEELFLIHNGLVRVYRLNESGEQVVLALLGGGDFFGEMGLFTDSVRTAWVEAVTGVKLYRMRKADFRNLLLATPELCWQMLGILSRRLAKMDEQMENLVCLNAEERLMKALFMLAQELGHRERENWVLPWHLTHQLLGELIGASRETVTRSLGRLEKKGLLRKGARKSSGKSEGTVLKLLRPEQ